MEEFLEVKNLYKSYGDKVILRNLNFSLKKGDRLCILGENGSGKSTLLKIIAGYENPDAGGVFLDKKIVEGFGKKLVKGTKDIILLDQSFELNENLSIKNNILYALRELTSQSANEIAKEVINWFELQLFKDKKPYELSGGQRQRACLAQCVAQNPKVLLLDEPFSNQDLKQKEQLLTDLWKINQIWGTSLIYVTHEASNALSFSTELMVIKNGRIIQKGSPKNLYKNPIDEHVAMLTGDYNILSHDLLKAINFKPKCHTKYLIRPENIKVTKSNGLKAKLLSVNFCGYFIKLKIELFGQALTVYCFEETMYEVNQIIYAKIDLSKIIEIDIK